MADGNRWICDGMPYAGTFGRLLAVSNKLPNSLGLIRGGTSGAFKHTFVQTKYITQVAKKPATGKNPTKSHNVPFFCQSDSNTPVTNSSTRTENFAYY